MLYGDPIKVRNPGPATFGGADSGTNRFVSKIRNLNYSSSGYFLVCIWYKIYPKHSTLSWCRAESTVVALKEQPTGFQSDFKNDSKFTFSLAIPSFLLITARCLRTVWTEVLNAAAISLQLKPFLTMWQISNSRRVSSR